MKNDKNIIHINESKLRNLLWFVYKWFLIGLAMYLFYQCLQIEPDITFIEITLCNSVAISFLTIIEHHANLKKIAENPNQHIIPSRYAVLGWILSGVMYVSLITLSLVFLGNFAWITIIAMIWIVGTIAKKAEYIIDPYGYLK